MLYLWFLDVVVLAEVAAPRFPISAGLLAGVFLLTINAYFVALEFALVSVRKTRVDEQVKQEVRGALAVQRGKNKVDDFVSAAQLGITVASLALGMVAESTVIRILHEWLGVTELFGLGIEHGTGLGLAISLSIVTVFHVVLGEQVPKLLAINNPLRVALLTAPAAELFLKVCRPAIRLLSWLTNLMLSALGVKNTSGGHPGAIYSEEEIESLLASRESAGLSEPAENEMISQVFDLFDMVASQIMIPRTEMYCVPSTLSLRELMKIAGEQGHDRYPVFEESADKIVGVILMKDLVSFLGRNSEGLDSDITYLWREPLFVPGTLPCSLILTRLKEHRTRLAIVLDEYGGTAGMFTLGDVLHRIVGEVDEKIEVVKPEDIVELKNGIFSVSGLSLTEDVDKFFQVSVDDEMNDTIGGVVFSALGRAPLVGDQVEVDGLAITVEVLSGLRIDRLLVQTSKGEF